MKDMKRQRTQLEPVTVAVSSAMTHRKKSASILDWIVLSSLATAIVLVALWFIQAPPPVSLWWDSLMALGLISALMMLLLGMLSPRFWSLNGHDATALLHLHRYLGIAVLVLAGAHAVGLLVVEPITLEYLKLRAPNYMLAGIGAVLALIALVWPSIKRMAWRMHYRLWHVSHGVLSVLALGLTLWHLLGSGYGFDEGWKQILVTAVFVAPTLWIYVSGRRRPAVPWRTLSQDTLKGRDALLTAKRYAYLWIIVTVGFSVAVGAVRQI